MTYTEKPSVDFIEDIQKHSNSDTAELLEDDFSDMDEAKVLRKIDFNLLPLASILYLLAFLDRGNIGNAKIEGLTDDLNLSSSQYNLCLTIFFITYSLFEVPSNMLLKKLGKQSIFLPSIMFLWGIVMTFMGFVNNFSGLFAARLFLGIAESGLYPGVSFGLTMYYCKKEMQFRQAIFYGAASIAGAFSGLLAFGIAKMDGVGGKAGWRWIFILEGLLTVIFSVIAYFFLPDYPDTAKFLTERERAYVIWRLKHDSNEIPGKASALFDDRNVTEDIKPPNFSLLEESDDLTLRESLIKAFKDWQIYVHILLYYGVIAPTYGISLFLPSVVKALGYTNSKAQLMTVPIYITASISAVTQAYFADKVGVRSPFVACNLVVVMTGFTMAIIGDATGKPEVIYGGVFIGVVSLYTSFSAIIAWLSNNLANSRKRAIGMAMQIGIGNMGGAFASNFYKTGKYSLGHSLELGFATMGLISCITLILGYKSINKKRRQSLIEGKYADYSDVDFFRLGDKSPHYKYRL